MQKDYEVQNYFSFFGTSVLQIDGEFGEFKRRLMQINSGVQRIDYRDRIKYLNTHGLHR